MEAVEVGLSCQPVDDSSLNNIYDKSMENDPNDDRNGLIRQMAI